MKKSNLVLDKETQKAWDSNWQPFEVEKLLEIFKYPRVKKQLELFFKYISKSDKILEGGCGLGPYLIYLRKKGYNVIGIDYNEEPIRKIKKYDSSLPVSVMDVRKMSFEDKSFDAYISLAENIDKTKGQAFNIASHNIMSVSEIVKKIFIALNKPIKIKILNKAKTEIPKQYLDGSKIKQFIGWVPQTSFEHAIRETFNWYEENLI